MLPGTRKKKVKRKPVTVRYDKRNFAEDREEWQKELQSVRKCAPIRKRRKKFNKTELNTSKREVICNLQWRKKCINHN